MRQVSSSKQDKFISFRSTYQSFFFEDFNIQLNDSKLEVEYKFSIDRDIVFKPTFNIPLKDYYQIGNVESQNIRSLIFHIGMVELVSYWKSTCPKEVVIEVANLNDEQIAFWKKLYYNGLGEFFYLNGISVSQDDFMQIRSSSDTTFTSFELPHLDGVIIPVGGGKDSVVSLELLKAKQDALAMIINPRGASLNTAKAAGFGMDRILEVQRKIDPTLLELNAKGYLNGHTPFSSLLAFQSILLAMLSGKREIALSNEGSANEATVIGTNVNHQYSKSYEFESDFRDYVAKYLTKDIHYYSFLRPLSELQIACLFSNFTHQHSHFRSCNVGSKKDIWCCSCPKCLFTYIILSPFLSLFELKEIFGEDLLDKEELIQDFDELTGIADVKPFECVGTVDEVRTALCLARNNYKESELPLLLQRFETYLDVKQQCQNLNLHQLLTQLEEEHFLTEELLIILQSKLENYATKN